MKVIIPLAGKGSRLMPATKYVPKPLISVAGQTVLDYVMEKLEGLDIEELIVITGHLKESVESYIRSHYDVPARFVEQKVQDGTASAIDLARPFVDGPVLIIFVDTVFDADLSIVNATEADGILWAKEVEDYQRFGVIVTDDDGNMKEIVEKPDKPVSKFANIGLYFVKNSALLFEGIAHVMAQPPNKGEYYLTDAFQYMVDNGARLSTAAVEGWYDCGKLGTTLETNAHLLANGRANDPAHSTDVNIIPPVRIAADVSLESCTIGPNVSIDEGVEVVGSRIENSIVSRDCKVVDASITNCLLGDGCVVVGGDHDSMIGSKDEMAPAP